MSFHEFKREGRQRAFETLLQWEGRCNASTLARLFDIDRNNAGRDIRDYVDQFPGTVVYDRFDKVYRPTDQFRAQRSSGLVPDYLSLCQQHNAHNPDIEVGFSPIVEPPAQLFKELLDHIRCRNALQVTYRSWNHPDGTERVIHPHSMAFSNIRWHVRAFDERTESFRDFHLGRFADYRTARVSHFVDAAQDEKWNTTVTLLLIPNPALTRAEQRLVHDDYGMENNRLELTCRLAMSHYLLQAFRVQIGQDQKATSPREFPLFLENKRDIEAGLFDSSLSTHDDGHQMGL